MTALRCRAISKSLGGRPVLRDLDFTVARGEVITLLGASGSGKTTLLRVISGLQEPDSGELEIGGKLVWGQGRAEPAERRRVGMIFQDYALWPHMTVEGNLRFGLEALHLSAPESRARIDHALEVTRLSAFRGRYPSELSGGQQQRVAIARCLAARPALMLFDEPLSNLDAALREDMRVEMMDLVRAEGATVVYVTHDQAEAMAVSDRIAVMREGEIAQFDTPETIYERPANSFVASFIGGFSLLGGRAAGGMFSVPFDEMQSLRTPGAKDGPGLLVIRPEDARPAADFPDNRVTGKVVARAFQGRCWRLALDVGQSRVRLDWPAPAEIGANLTFSLSPDRCVVLAG
ncbi:MAG TPA: ABC transporter ATP-binding protein [Devosiaceae bacterium]|jgi:ABC-type Fe3+/spermidine/putrescine transport system ATPase subunit